MKEKIGMKTGNVVVIGRNRLQAKCTIHTTMISYCNWILGLRLDFTDYLLLFVMKNFHFLSCFNILHSVYLLVLQFLQFICDFK